LIATVDGFLNRSTRAIQAFMPVAIKLLPLILLLSGCSLGECAHERTPDAVKFEQALALPELGPGDVWREDGSLEIFLRHALKTQSVAAVAARYGLQCLARDEASGCNDCFTCRTSVKQLRFGQMSVPLPVLALKCVDYGEVLVQAEIGPQSSVKVMAYWKTSLEARRREAR
jgi:hypothetical protein